MLKRVKVIQNSLEENYGFGSMVKSLAIVIDNRWNELNRVVEDGEHDPMAMEIWYWFTGGSTAIIAAENVRESVRQYEEFLLRPPRPLVYPKQETVFDD